MSKIHRAEALRRVNDYYDKLEAVEGVNDPDRDAKARDAAWEAYKRVREIGAPLVAERLGAARLANREYRDEIPWGEKAREAAAKPFAKGSMGMDQHEAAAQRRVLTRYLLDVACSDLDPQLVYNFASAFHALNLGFSPSIVAPYRVQGLKKGSAPKATFHFFAATLVYYLHGYRGCTIEKVLLDETDTFGGMSRDALNTIIARLGISESVAKAREIGRADNAAGRPEQSPFVHTLDLIALRQMRKHF